MPDKIEIDLDVDLNMTSYETDMQKRHTIQMKLTNVLKMTYKY